MKYSASYLLVILALCILISQNGIAQNQPIFSNQPSRLISPSSSELLEKPVPFDIGETFRYSSWHLLMRQSYFSNLRSSIELNKLPAQLLMQSRQLLSDLERFINLLLSIVTTSTISFSQEEDPLRDIFQDITVFTHFRVMVTDSPNCQEMIYNSLKDTQLGSIMSEFFEVFLEIDMGNYMLDRYPGEYVMNQARNSSQNLAEFLVLWIEEKRQSTTPEEINNMRQELEDLKAEWEACLQNETNG